MKSRSFKSISPLWARPRAWIAVSLISVVPAIAVPAFTLGLRVNLTASEPLGIWRIHPLERPLAVGDLVFVCPPQTADMAEARGRGYLRRGFCPGGYAPLIKMIVAVSGQKIEVDQLVRIDGLNLPHSSPASRDGKGRVLRAFNGGIVPVGQVFLYSSFVGSLDSRYFGPLPSSGVLGLASEVLTYAP